MLPCALGTADNTYTKQMEELDKVQYFPRVPEKAKFMCKESTKDSDIRLELT